MSVSVRVRDETLGGREAPAEWTLEVLAARLTLDELLRRRVEEEIRDREQGRRHALRTLVGPAPAESAREPSPTAARRRVDPAAEVERAREAFRRNAFFVLVDDRQVTRLDEEIVLGVDTRVSFVRLVPLVGG